MTTQAGYSSSSSSHLHHRQEPETRSNMGVAIAIAILAAVFILLVLKLTCRCSSSRRDENTEDPEAGELAEVQVDTNGLPTRPPPAYSVVDVGGRGEGCDWDARSVDTLPKYPGVAQGA